MQNNYTEELKEKFSKLVKYAEENNSIKGFDLSIFSKQELTWVMFELQNPYYKHKYYKL